MTPPRDNPFPQGKGDNEQRGVRLLRVVRVIVPPVSSYIGTYSPFPLLPALQSTDLEMRLLFAKNDAEVVWTKIAS